MKQHNDILLEQYRLLHQQAPASQTGGLIVAGVLIATMYPTSDFYTLVFWGLALLLVTAARYLVWQHFKPKITQDHAPVTWYRAITSLIFVSGCIWAIGFFLFFPENDLLLVGLLLAMNFAIIAGAIGSLSSVLMCYIIYIAPITVSVIARIFLEDDIPLAVGIGFASFSIVCTLYARNIQNTIIESISLRFENQKLIEQLKMNEKQLQISVQTAQETSAAKSRFLAVASHDLSQPLHALELFTNSMIEETDPDKRSKLMHNAHKSTKMLSDMFSSLLDISKLEANIVKADLAQTNIHDVLTPLIESLQPRADAKAIKLQVSVEDATLNTDPTLLQRILLNLMGNALKYTEQGSVSITGEKNGSGYLITVADSGPGIPQNDLENIFKDYYQVDGQKVGGMGLGLAIVSRIARLLDITIDVSSELNQGTTFKIVVPNKFAIPPP